MGYPPAVTVATAAAGGSVAVEPATGSASQGSGRREQTFKTVAVEVNQTGCQTVASQPCHDDDDVHEEQPAC